MGGQSSHIPLKVNTAGVIPVIFASSILSVPQIVVNLFNIKTSGVGAKIIQGMSQGYWFNRSYPWASIGLIVYILLVFFFAYFYMSSMFLLMWAISRETLAESLQRSAICTASL